MKIFIVFLAFIILWTACLSFQTDLNNLLILQRQAKNLAEDCAAGSAMMLDREELSNGRIRFDQSSAESYNSFLLRQQKFLAESVFFEDYSGVPSVIVKLHINKKNFFRNRKVAKTYLQVSSKYGWE